MWNNSLRKPSYDTCSTLKKSAKRRKILCSTCRKTKNKSMLFLLSCARAATVYVYAMSNQKQQQQIKLKVSNLSESDEIYELFCNHIKSENAKFPFVVFSHFIFGGISHRQ